jgi:hypothetical protein
MTFAWWQLLAIESDAASDKLHSSIPMLIIYSNSAAQTVKIMRYEKKSLSTLNRITLKQFFVTHSTSSSPINLHLLTNISSSNGRKVPIACMVIGPTIGQLSAEKKCSSGKFSRPNASPLSVTLWQFSMPSTATC